MSSVPSITLNDGNTIPQLGFGVFQIKPDQTAQRSANLGSDFLDMACLVCTLFWARAAFALINDCLELLATGMKAKVLRDI